MSSNNKPFVHKEYLPVADNAAVTSEESAVTQAGKLVALDNQGKINRYFIPYNDLSVTSLRINDGELITGDIGLYGNGTITVTRSGSDFYFDTNFPDGILSIKVGEQVLTGDVTFLAGQGLDITSSVIDQSITISNTGVLSLNGLTQDISIESLGGLSVTASSGVLRFTIDEITWDKFDASSEARAQKIVVQSGIFLGTDVVAAIYQESNQTVIRGTSGVRFYDPVSLDNAKVVGGNGLFFGSSRIQDQEGLLHIQPSGLKVVFSEDTELLGIRGMQPAFESGSYLTLADGLYAHTFAHNENLWPLSVLVTYVPGFDEGDFTETTQGLGADIFSSTGYTVQFNKNAITVQANLDVSSPPYFRVRTLFAAEGVPTALAPVSAVSAAPNKPSVTQIGAPSTGGYPEQIILTTRPVSNASSYNWSVSGSSWETSTPLLSTSTVSGLSFAAPGVHTIAVYGLNASGSGPSITADISIRPKQPILSSGAFTVTSSGNFRNVTVNLTYQPPCSIEIVNTATSGAIVYETVVSYSPPGSIVGPTGSVVTTGITLKNLYTNTAYNLAARAFVSGSSPELSVSSDLSEVFTVGPL